MWAKTLRHEPVRNISNLDQTSVLPTEMVVLLFIFKVPVIIFDTKPGVIEIEDPVQIRSIYHLVHDMMRRLQP